MIALESIRDGSVLEMREFGQSHVTLGSVFSCKSHLTLVQAWVVESLKLSPYIIDQLIVCCIKVEIMLTYQLL